MEVSFKDEDYPWFIDIANCKAIGQPSKVMKFNERKRFSREATRYVWDDPILFCIGVDNFLRRCVTKGKQASILWHCHNSPYGGHFNGEIKPTKILQARFYWPTLFKDAHNPWNLNKQAQTGKVVIPHKKYICICLGSKKCFEYVCIC